MSNLLNKAKEAAKDVLHGDKREDNRSSNSGPHSSNIMNKMDPRVDSDKDNRDDPTSRVGGYGDDRNFDNSNTGGGYNTGTTTDTGSYGTSTATGGQYDDPRSTNTGPHSSNVANKLDPRVDSDRDNRNDPSSRVGGYGQTQQDTGRGGDFSDTTTRTEGGYGTGTGADTGLSGGRDAYDTTTGQYDNPRSGNTGPHGSSAMNKMDPRVDSDRDGRNDPTSRVGGYGETQQGMGRGGDFSDTTTRTGGGYGNTDSGFTGGRDTGYGDNQQGLGRGGDFSDTTTRTGGGYGTTDSGLTGGREGGYGGDNFSSSATPGSGNAARTAGPHDSDFMNKADPRVDSDMDGSRTYGGDRTNY